MLVVNADDLGYSAGVDRAILQAHREGIVRSTSLLVTFPRSAEAAEIARAERGLEVGLHLDLVEGTPVADAASVPSLVDREGRFLGLAQLLGRVATFRVRPGEIATEVRAQVRRARELGTPALAWDSHRHVHMFPPVARVVAAVARDEGARWIRRTFGPWRPAAWRVFPRSLVPAWKANVLHLSAWGSRPFFARTAGPDWYLDLTSQPRADAAWLALAAALPGLGEISAHPGIANGSDGSDAIALRRPLDLALLTDPLVRAAFGDDSVRWRVI